MSGHEFEKQVRQKLNDLKMTPTAEAWENIEEKLRERKRRPVAIFWLPLLVIGLAAGGYLFLNNDQKTVLSDTNSTPNVQVQPKSEDASGAIIDVPKENIPAEKKNAPGEITAIAPQQNNDETRTEIISAPQEDKRASGAILQDVPKAKAPLYKTNAPGSEKTSSNALSITPQEKDEISLISRSEFSLKNSFAFGVLRNSNDKFLSPSSIIAVKNTKSYTPEPSLSNKRTSPEKSNKWSWGLSGSAGVSAVNEGNFLDFTNAQVEDVSQVPTFFPVVARPSYKPSNITPGFTYSAGAFVKRELNKRFSVSIGANYLQLNTRNKVGNEINGSQVVNNGSSYLFVYNYFRVDQDNSYDYRNKYHLIEVPVELHTRINNSKKLPIHVNTGVSVSQLLKSNSLHFDGTTGVYYRNDKLLNQTQFAVKTGVSVGVLNKTTRPIWIGPSARYNVSKILQKDVSARKNFMSLGIDVKMFIK